MASCSPHMCNWVGFHPLYQTTNHEPGFWRLAHLDSDCQLSMSRCLPHLRILELLRSVLDMTIFGSCRFIQTEVGIQKVGFLQDGPRSPAINGVIYNPTYNW